MTTSKKEEKTFEEFFLEVEETVKDLESGNFTVTSLLEKTEKGIGSLKQCYTILNQTEKKIEILKKNFDGEFKKEPFPSHE